MPPKEMTIMGDRCEFVLLATQAGANVRALCRHFEISSRTGYTWIARYRTGGLDALADRSRRPASSPRRTDAAVEAAVLAARDAHPDWGGRTIAAWLGGQGMAGPPAPTRSPRSCAATGASAPGRPGPSRVPSVASSTRSRTTCGRWISWATGPWATGPWARDRAGSIP